MAKNSNESNEILACDIDDGIEKNPSTTKKKPKKSNVMLPISPHVSQAMQLQTETNNLLKHIISQNNKQIILLTKLVEKE